MWHFEKRDNLIQRNKFIREFKLVNLIRILRVTFNRVSTYLFKVNELVWKGEHRIPAHTCTYMRIGEGSVIPRTTCSDRRFNIASPILFPFHFECFDSLESFTRKKYSLEKI